MKKLVSLLLALSLALTALAGCDSSSGASSAAPADGGASAGDSASGGSSSMEELLAAMPESYDPGVQVAGTPELYANTDLSDAYTVNLYLIGDKPNDYDRVEELINEYLAPFNTSIKTTIMSWSDYQTMYSLVLAGGEQVDLIFTAPWCYMFTEAPKGSFLTIDEEFHQKYMPLTNKYQAPESWDETTIQGKTIAVPSDEASPMGKIVAVRKDLMDKYGIDDLETWDDYMEYMLTIAEKETPESGIYALAAAADNNELWDVYRQQYDMLFALDNSWLDMAYEYDGELPTSDEITLVYEHDAFREYCYDMKTLADAGCWSRSALTNTVTDDDAFGNLQGASIAWNTSVFTYMEQAEKTEGVECMAYDLTKDHLVAAEAYSNNDIAITAGSKNPERAAMVLDLMKFDTYVNNLLMLGIKDEHYSIDDQGQYTELAAATEYPANNLSASWAIKNNTLKEAGTPERELVITDSWEERIVMNPCITFVFDDTNVKAQCSAVIAVMQDYVPMLELGLVDDVDTTLDEMLQKCNDSGLQEVKDEFFRQYEEWYATR